MMISIGNVFFKYRNWLFIPLYLGIFIPSSALLSNQPTHVWLIIIGLTITITGQLIRGATIGLAYIKRGGKNKQVYAKELVTEGIFSHCRNPLYVGNVLMLLGLGVLANSLLYIGLFIPAFLFIYHAIVLAEENFLRNKFGEQFDTYCARTNRWIPNPSGLKKTFAGMRFNWRRWLLKEYNTQMIWLSGIALLLLFKYPELTSYNTDSRNVLLTVIFLILLTAYSTIRYLKKSGKMTDLQGR